MTETVRIYSTYKVESWGAELRHRSGRFHHKHPELCKFAKYVLYAAAAGLAVATVVSGLVIIEKPAFTGLIMSAMCYKGKAMFTMEFAKLAAHAMLTFSVVAGSIGAAAAEVFTIKKLIKADEDSYDEFCKLYGFLDEHK